MAGIGHPLEPGTYYVGVFNYNNVDPASYTLESRGIGTDPFYPLTTLNFTAGSNATITNLVPREAKYFKVTVPANTPSWEITLDPTLGEMMLMARRGFIPDPEPIGVTQDPGVTQWDTREVRVQKDGPERYVILPPDGQTSLIAGDYYLAVVSEGQNPADGNHVGTGNSSGTLTSRGSLVVTHLGTATAVGVGQAVNLAGGQTKGFRVTVPAGTATLELRLNNRVGNPWLAVVPGLMLPPGVGYFPPYFGSEGGQTSGTPSWSYDLDLVTIANPPSGDYSITVNAAFDSGTGTWSAASANLLVQAVPPTVVTFNGGTATVTDQQAQSWKYFRVDVPAGVLGWDLRVRSVTGGDPQMVVRRDLLPEYLGTGLNNWAPSHSATWPSGNLWTQQRDWTQRSSNADETTALYRRFVAGIGHPLEPGTYYVGVFNSDNVNPASYTLESRGIGTGQFYPVTTLNFAAGSNATITNLAPREAKYFKVTVPASTSSWEITLDPTLGEMMLIARRGFIPDTEPAGVTQDPTGNGQDSREVRVQKDGPERYVILPINGEASLIAGDYYLAVVSEGQNPADGNHVGSGNSSGTLTSRGSLVVTNLGTASVAGVGQTVTLAGGQTKGFRVTVPAGTATLELRLSNRVGNPSLAVVPGLMLPPGVGYFPPYFGSEGGQKDGTPSWSYDDDLITIANPPPGDYSLTVNAGYDSGTQTFAPASATLLIRQRPPTPLNFDAALNGGGGTNTAAQQIINGERVAYAVPIPTTLSGSPVIGWIVNVTTIQGTARLRIYKTAGNTSPDSMILSNDTTTVIVPPWLVPGQTWYAEVEGVGATDYTLTSRAITLNRNAYTMPVGYGQSFGDSGVQNNGTPLPGDQGIDLGRSDWHFYAVDVPAGNGALLRSELQAISGNPDLYIREDGVPTIHHLSNGAAQGYPLYDRSLTGSTTEYGNWVPLDGRTEKQLQPGRWYLGVKAAGNSNVRYRLVVSTGAVQDLSLNTLGALGVNITNGGSGYTSAPTVTFSGGGGSGAAGTAVIQNGSVIGVNVTNGGTGNTSLPNVSLSGGGGAGATATVTYSQILADNDWRYYRFTVPANAPNNWALTFSQQVGDVVMWLRDSLPPGQGYNNAPSACSWYSDNKNQGPYSADGHDAAGTYTFTTPPLRPGHTYYAGFRSNNSATFSVSSATSGGSIGTPPVLAFYDFDRLTPTVSGSVPANGSLLYQIPVPVEASRLKYAATHASEVSIRIEQGTLPALSGSQHYETSAANSTLNQALSPTGWPWVPNQVYYLRVVNASGSAQNFAINIDGRNALTEDEDTDGLPDAWEMQYFGSLAYGLNDDPDGDGESNRLEFAFGSNPLSGRHDSNLPIQVLPDRIRVQFTRRRGDTQGLSYLLETTTTLENPVSWAPIGAPWVVTITPLDSTYEQVACELPKSQAPAQAFMRMTVGAQ